MFTFREVVLNAPVKATVLIKKVAKIHAASVFG
jgi:hypothetical protein